MVDPFWTALFFKAVATALVVVSASVAAEKSGPFWGGLISCLPVAAGPGYVMLAMSQSPAFVADAALSSLAAGMATWAYLYLFVRLSHGLTLWPSLLGALVVWLILAIAIRAVPWTLATAVGGNAVAFALAARHTPVIELDPASGGARQRTWFELPLRAVLVGLFVAIVVTVADAIGPAATGVAAVFPIALSSMAVAVHRRFGIRGSAAGLSSAVRPLLGIAAGLVAVHLAAPQWGSWPALATGLGASLAWPSLLIAARAARRQA